MSSQWFYVQNGQRVGPVTLEQIRTLIASGTIGEEDLAWSQSLQGWTPVRAIPELAPSRPQPIPVPFQAPVPVQPATPVQPAVSIQLDEPAPAPLKPNAPTPYAAPISAVSPMSQEGLAETLKQTRPWVRFLAIMGFIGMGFMVLAGLFMMIGGAAGGRMGAPMAGFGVLYILSSLIMLPPLIFLNRYASRITDYLASNTQEDLESALTAQKSFWKYMGVFSLIYLCLVVIGVLVAMAVGIGSVMMR